MSRKEHRAALQSISRRGFIGGGAALAGLVAASGLRPGVTHAEALANLNILPEDLPAPQYRMATVEVGAASTWVSHGIETSKFVGSLLGVEVEAFDGQFDPALQLSALQTISGEDWDFVALHPASSDALVDGTDAIIGNDIPLIIMDTRLIQDPEANMEYNFLTFIEPDNIYMGSTVAEELMKAINYQGEVIHTRGQLGHTGSQGRYDGFQQVVAKYPDVKVVDETPGEWQTDITASLWCRRRPQRLRGYPRRHAVRLGHQPVRPHSWRLGLGWLPERLRHRQPRRRDSQVHPRRRWPDRGRQRRGVHLAVRQLPVLGIDLP